MERKYPTVASKRVDMKEFELPETFFVHDIDNKVLQGIVLKSLSEIEGIALASGNFLENILGRSIWVEQDVKKQCVSIRIEVSIAFGISIPGKAAEVQNKITHDLTAMTGLHVQTVHVDFKNVLPSIEVKKLSEMLTSHAVSQSFVKVGKDNEDEYNDEF